MEFQVDRVEFDEGDFLVGFTDGTTDAKNASGEQFSEDRFLDEISHPWTSMFSMLFDLNTKLQKHIGDQNQFDDITLISFRRKVDGGNGQHAICRKADVEAIEELRDFVESAAQHVGLSAENVFAFKLSVDEICTNIIQYGYQGREPGMLSLSFHVDEGAAWLVIRDDGKHFSPDQVKSPDIEAGWEEREVGGLGIFFVKELMDNVTYNGVGDGMNEFILKKRLAPSNFREE